MRSSITTNSRGHACGLSVLFLLMLACTKTETKPEPTEQSTKPLPAATTPPARTAPVERWERFPERVAGFSFVDGAEPQVRRACMAAGGTFLPVTSVPDSVDCSVLPNDPLQLRSGGSARLKLCAGVPSRVLCGVALVWSMRATASAARSMFLRLAQRQYEAKYGPPEQGASSASLERSVTDCEILGQADASLDWAPLVGETGSRNRISISYVCLKSGTEALAIINYLDRKIATQPKKADDF